MKYIKALLIAFSMYSRIPVPIVKWEEDAMKYPLCFFPLIGWILGIIEWILGQWLFREEIGVVFRSICFTLLPFLVIGGIHLDGFMDTIDGLASYGDQEKKLEILKDSHPGAFAVIGVVVYFLWNVAIWSEMEQKMLLFLPFLFGLSRCYSGWTIVTFKMAKNTGLAKTFADGAQKNTVRNSMIFWMFLSYIGIFALDWKIGSCILAVNGISCLAFKKKAYKEFGGITGDLAGYFLCLHEAVMLTVLVLAGGGLWN